jgi:glutamine synthetase
MGFDGSSLSGYAGIEETDMVAIPDPSTFKLLPWRPKEGGTVARMFCDVQDHDGVDFKGDPRWILKNNLAKAKDKGYTYYVGPELEFFYFKNSEGTPQTLDRGGYLDLTPLDVASDLRRDTVFYLEEMGIGVEYSHHEISASQHEIGLRYTDALTMADNAMTYKLVVKEVAQKYGVYATFMPKPLTEYNGSGMHVHQSLFKGDKNIFFDPKDSYYLSNEAKFFVGGLLKYAPEFTLITNQWVNSYKRLVPDFGAPIFITWAQRNRSNLVRIPISKPDKPSSARIEFRSPDPACNPYLVFSVMLAAGLKGIEEKIEPGDPFEGNILDMTEMEKQRITIRRLPETLLGAIKLAGESEFLSGVLGEYALGQIRENKKREWARYRKYVSGYEIDNYLPIL